MCCSSGQDLRSICEARGRNSVLRERLSPDENQNSGGANLKSGEALVTRNVHTRAGRLRITIWCIIFMTSSLADLRTFCIRWSQHQCLLPRPTEYKLVEFCYIKWCCFPYLANRPKKEFRMVSVWLWIPLVIEWIHLNDLNVSIKCEIGQWLITTNKYDLYKTHSRLSLEKCHSHRLKHDLQRSTLRGDWFSFLASLWCVVVVILSL